MLAALGTGVVADAEALRGWVHLRERARPDPGERARYDRAHAQYIAAYPALRGVMHALRD
jgi:sugar (pentulose or hexulose) kinase